MRDELGRSASTIEAALGLRAHLGSREALVRAAFDLIDTTPGLRVRRRSLLWHEPESAELCAAIGLDADFNRKVLEAAARALEQRIGRGHEGDRAPLRVELLWAYDPLGKARPIPPSDEIDPLADKRPPMPPGSTWLHAEVPTRASACGPLSEVASESREPSTGRFVSELLYTVPEPFIEKPRPFAAEFDSTRRLTKDGAVYESTTFERGDLLAAVAEAYGHAPPSGTPHDPSTPNPDATVTVAVATAPTDGLRERIWRWLHGVRDAMVREKLSLRRAVVIGDADDRIDGMLFGTTENEPPALEQLRNIRASFDKNANRYRAEVFVSLGGATDQMPSG